MGASCCTAATAEADRVLAASHYVDLAHRSADVYTLAEQFSLYDIDGLVPLSDVPKVLSPLRVLVTNRDVKLQFHKNQNVGFDQLVQFYLYLTARPALSSLFSKYCPTGYHVSPEKFVQFLAVEQGEKLPMDQATKLLKDDPLTEALFVSKMCSGMNRWTSRLYGTVHHDLNEPLLNFFVETATVASVPANADSIKQLLRTCRCLVLPLRSGNQEPVVQCQGGKTLPLCAALTTVKNCAFEKSPLPVIICLSLGADTSGNAQLRIAQLVSEALGNALQPATRFCKPDSMPLSQLANRFLLFVDANTDIAPELSTLAFLSTVHSSSSVAGHVQNIQGSTRKQTPGCEKSFSFVKDVPANTDCLQLLGAGVQFIGTPQADLSKRMLQTVFQRNGRCGYVQRPTAQRQTGINICVISGHYLPKPPKLAARDTFGMRLELSVHQGGATPTCADTCTVENNSFNPIWNRVFTVATTAPELTIVQLRVICAYKQREECVAEVFAPVSALRRGYRIIPLEDTPEIYSGPKAHLLVHLDVRTADLTGPDTDAVSVTDLHMDEDDEAETDENSDYTATVVTAVTNFTEHRTQ
eukprot:TRINITY_DN13600_c0_g1_i1.p1 TRINITY_DN13600_c0_g1~~TRINITY_DN13600_c0_g1_i1.p1  ORF type:complete len:583 (+),score=79.82 TRINITY_DN13600_c0_g1_i1:39-1787(+)